MNHQEDDAPAPAEAPRDREPRPQLARCRDWVLARLGLASRRELNDLHVAVRHQAQRVSASHARVMKQLERFEHKLDALAETTDDVDTILRRGRLRKVEHNVDALVRRELVDWGLPHPQALLSQRFRGWSQNEEDGITVALLRQVGVATRRFVEIGAGVNGGNSGFLAIECGWTGMMVESQPGRATRLAQRFGPAVDVVSARVSRENVNQILEEHGATGEIDLLSIDVDGIDFWVWDALSVCRPRLVIAEINPRFGLERSVAVPYRADFDRHAFDAPDGAYYGASLRAFVRLGVRKGYRLAVVEPRGVNAFFVREDLAGSLPAVSDAQLSLLAPRGVEAAPDALFAALERAGLPLLDVEGTAVPVGAGR